MRDSIRLVLLGNPGIEHVGSHFREAAAELRIAPAHCFVAEDAPAGIEAAKAGGMTGLGVARLGFAGPLRAVGADLVVTSLDEVAVDALVNGRLCRRPT